MLENSEVIDRKRDTDPCAPLARDRAFLLLEEDPELYQAVLDLEHEICCSAMIEGKHRTDCPYTQPRR